MDETTRSSIAIFMDRHFAKCDDFTSDLVTTDDIAQRLQKSLQIIVNTDPLNELLTEWGFVGNPIPNTEEMLWKVTCK